MPRTLPMMLLALATLGSPVVAVAGPGDGPGAQRPGAGMQRPDRRRDPGVREDRFLRMLESRDPERHAKVVEIRRDRPGIYRDLVRQTIMQLRVQGDTVARDKVRSLIDHSYTLKTQLDAYQAANTKERARLNPEIQGTVGALFELRQDLRRRQLAAMEDRLSKLRGEIEERDRNKEAIVEDFTDGLLGATTGGM